MKFKVGDTVVIKFYDDESRFGHDTDRIGAVGTIAEADRHDHSFYVRFPYPFYEWYDQEELELFTLFSKPRLP